MAKAEMDYFQKLVESDTNMLTVACPKHIYERDPLSLCRYPKEPNCR